MKKLAQIAAISSTAFAFLAVASNTFAQTASSSALTTPTLSKGGTGSSLPNAGSTEFTYVLFLGGVVLFIVGMLKLVSSYRRN